MPPDDLNPDIDELWRRAEASSLEPVACPEPDAGLSFSQAAWEALTLVRRKNREESEELSKLLGDKSRSLEELQKREAVFKAQIQQLRRSLTAQEAQIMQAGLETEGRIEAALKALDEERRERALEQEKLKALLAQMRQRMSKDNEIREGAEAAWRAKEEEYLDVLRERQAEVSRLQKESADSSNEVRRSSTSLREAKNALEKTLAELLEERRRYGESEKAKLEALKKVEAVEKHLQELSKIWQEERSEWRELWERERSAWQTQRAELSGWEENLRGEREAWHKDIQAKEKDHSLFVEAMNKSIRESAEAVAKLSALMRQMADRAGASSARLRRVLARKGLWGFAVAALAVAAAGLGGWNYWNRFHFHVVSVGKTFLSNPTGLAFDGMRLWASEWDGSLDSFDPQNPEEVIRSAVVLTPAPYHPASLVFADGSLWSLDAAQARILEHSPTDPAVVAAAYSTPGPAPTALAFDGENLWSFDAANGTLYRYGENASGARAVPLGRDLAVTAMAWINGRLWLFDSKTARLFVFERRGDALVYDADYALGERVLGMAGRPGTFAGGFSGLVGRRRVWVLAAPSAARPEPSLIEYSY